MTPAQARWFRDNCHFDRQRKISQSNIDRLATEMTNGTFIPGTQLYFCELPDGTLLLINGNHTAEAIAKSGIPQVMTITRARVSSMNEAGRLYAVFDIHKARSWLDSLKATGISEDSASRQAKILAALGCIENRFDQHGPQTAGPSRLQRIDRLVEYDAAASMFFDAISGGDSGCSNFAKRAAIMAVALITFRYQPSLAAEFWRTFALDDGLQSGAPEKALLGYLRNYTTKGGSMSRKIQTRAAAAAWNAKFRGDNVTMVRPNAMTSFFLLGTPYEKGLGEE